MTAEENMFGKVRGRVDEEHIRRCDRSLPHAAMAALIPMPPAQFAEFMAMFNRTFGGTGTSRFRIVPQESACLAPSPHARPEDR